ncbi:hypothetical protein A21D_02721 [Virgibacillus dokdonensis]|uniref:Uncharacterized protein n=1 Tax=Virgibacillus dokdonensis TaxID=302167 RepID=A0A2K9J1E1_9BACI|nr:hypothetical protein A21D_02721 [Virgibacillus dokdonensis]
MYVGQPFLYYNGFRIGETIIFRHNVLLISHVLLIPWCGWIIDNSEKIIGQEKDGRGKEK